MIKFCHFEFICTNLNLVALFKQYYLTASRLQLYNKFHISVGLGNLNKILQQSTTHNTNKLTATFP